MIPIAILGQSKWSLDDCISYALENNLDVNRQKLVNDIKSIAYSEAKWSFSPNIHLTSSITESFGRVLDQTTYEFIKNSDITSSSSSLSGSISLFNGWKRINSLKRAKMDMKASDEDMKAIKLTTKKNIACAFFTLLCCENNYSSALVTKDLLYSQVQRIELMVEAGKVTESDLLQAKSQLFAAENEVTSAAGDLRTARLELSQIMGLNDTNDIQVAWDEQIPECPNYSLFDKYITLRPEYKTSQIRLDISRKDLSIVKSSFFPSLSFSAGYGSSYSSSRKRIVQHADNTTQYKPYPFSNQYRDNANSYFSFTLTIPIIYGRSTANAVKKARIAILDAQYELQMVQKELYKEYNQAIVECETAYKQYISAAQQLSYSEEAERQVRERYNYGAADFNAWSTAITELAKAKYSLSLAKYSYILKAKIIEFNTSLSY